MKLAVQQELGICAKRVGKALECSLLFTSEHSNSVFSGATKVRWADAERLRRYTEAVENSAEAKGEMTQELQAWIDWARLKADCRDPLVPVSDAVLDGPESQAPGYHYW